jgi:hypothetical protein
VPNLSVNLGSTVNVGRPHYVTDYGAKGNSTYNEGGGNDDTAAIQRACNEAGAAGGCAVVVFPGHRSYLTTAKISVPEGVHLVGLGGHDGLGAALATIVADHQDAILECAVSGQNIFGTTIEGLCLRGISTADAGDKPTAGVRFVGVGEALAKPDSGTRILECWIQDINGNGVEVLSAGTTNFYWQGGRMDSTFGGYGFYVNLTEEFSNSIMQISNMTWVAGSASDGQGKGFLHLDGEGVSSGSGSNISIHGVNIEVGLSLTETYASGTYPYDRRGLIRCGVSPGLSSMQHKIDCKGLTVSGPIGSLASFCVVQVTAASGTDADAADKVLFTCLGGYTLAESNNVDETAATGELRLFGGKVPTARRFFMRSSRTGFVAWGQGPDNASNHVSSYVHHRYGMFRVRGLGIQAETVATLEFPSGGAGALAIVTDSVNTAKGAALTGGGGNCVLVMHTGSGWTII